MGFYPALKPLRRYPTKLPPTALREIRRTAPLARGWIVAIPSTHERMTCRLLKGFHADLDALQVQDVRSSTAPRAAMWRRKMCGRRAESVHEDCYSTGDRGDTELTNEAFARIKIDQHDGGGLASTRQNSAFGRSGDQGRSGQIS